MRIQSLAPNGLFRIGTIAFILGIVVFMVSGLFHPSREDANNHPRVFAEYAKSDIWIGIHIGQFTAYMLVYAVGFVALYRFLLIKSQFGIVSALAWLGLVLTIITAACLAILQAIDGISLKRAVDSWAAAPAEEKIAAFRVAESIRWTEAGINSISRILQGIVAVIFGIAIVVKSGVIPRWVGGTIFFKMNIALPYYKR